MDYKNIISNIKLDSKNESFNKSIKVLNSNGSEIGKLIPVGNWILKDKKIINLLKSWRQKAMKMYFSQFESTYERTFEYLKSFSIKEEDRIFFLLYDDKSRLVGHIGVADIDGLYSKEPPGDSAQLDNLMRGVVGGEPRLIYFAEVSLLHWCFTNLCIKKSSLHALSYNWLVMLIHQDVGYKKIENFSLKKHSINGEILHDFVTKSEANVNYQCINMVLTKKDFYKNAYWLNSEKL